MLFDFDQIYFYETGPFSQLLPIRHKTPQIMKFRSIDVFNKSSPVLMKWYALPLLHRVDDNTKNSCRYSQTQFQSHRILLEKKVDAGQN